MLFKGVKVRGVFAESASNFDLSIWVMKKRGAFTVPPLDEIREASKIRVENTPSVFEPSRPTEPEPGLQAKEGETLVRDVHVLASKSAGRNTNTGSFQETATPSSYHPHAIIATGQQKRNPLMKYIRNVPWEVGDIVPDFELGKTTCALYLSIRYHLLHPDYIHDRLKTLGKMYLLRILLVHVDTSEHQKPLKELTKIALLADFTLMLAWSYEEAARYLETYKAYENKPPDLLKERIDSDFSSRVIECLTTVKKVSKTDAGTLINSFKTMEKLIKSSKEDLTLCPGLGPQKAQRLHSLFHEPFLRDRETTSSKSCAM